MSIEGGGYPLDLCFELENIQISVGMKTLCLTKSGDLSCHVELNKMEKAILDSGNGIFFYN